MLVYRPTDPARFNGTVILEWLNVSGGVDAATDWVVLHNELIRGGYAWVGISAQKMRSEEHTSELQSLMRISYAVFCLKKKKHSHEDNKCTITCRMYREYDT